NDGSGDGSQGRPWATIGHALAALPQEGGDTVLVQDGEYVGANTVTRAFGQRTTVKAEHPYRARLTSAAGGVEPLRIYTPGPARLRFEGFVISNADPSYACTGGRESYYLIHLQDASDVQLVDNVVFGNNRPGHCNELLKINRSVETAYPKDILIQGNLFYDQADAGGADLIDAVRPGEVEIADNIFLGDPAHARSQSFITLKRQAPASGAPKSPRYWVHRNVFLSWGGKTDQAFVQLGEDGVAEVEIEDALIENNLMIGNSPTTMAAPFQLKGAQNVRVRANTVVGDLPSGSFGFRIGTEGENPAVSGFLIGGNLFADPTGTMGSRLVNSYGQVNVSSITLDHNLFWNGGNPLPTGGSVAATTDAHRLVADPLLPVDQSGLVLPRFDEAAGRFPSGRTTIRDELLRLVETHGALGAGSPAIDSADLSDMPAEDIRGLARDPRPDRGAYEFGAGTIPSLDAGAVAPEDAGSALPGADAAADAPGDAGGTPSGADGGTLAPGTDASGRAGADAGGVTVISEGCGCAAGGGGAGVVAAALGLCLVPGRRSRR
ncbi:MAG: hypothetical protein HY901_14060, partial [Deltaproteobacteria bacterium]|nr:hypothetical protein [Deltaproteobacteria bacterium]